MSSSNPSAIISRAPALSTRGGLFRTSSRACAIATELRQSTRRNNSRSSTIGGCIRPTLPASDLTGHVGRCNYAARCLVRPRDYCERGGDPRRDGSPPRPGDRSTVGHAQRPARPMSRRPGYRPTPQHPRGMSPALIMLSAPPIAITGSKVKPPIRRKPSPPPNPAHHDPQ